MNYTLSIFVAFKQWTAPITPPLVPTPGTYINIKGQTFKVTTFEQTADGTVVHLDGNTPKLNVATRDETVALRSKMTELGFVEEGS